MVQLRMCTRHAAGCKGVWVGNQKLDIELVRPKLRVKESPNIVITRELNNKQSAYKTFSLSLPIVLMSFQDHIQVPGLLFVDYSCCTSCRGGQEPTETLLTMLQ